MKRVKWRRVGEGEGEFGSTTEEENRARKNKENYERLEGLVRGNGSKKIRRFRESMHYTSIYIKNRSTIRDLFSNKVPLSNPREIIWVTKTHRISLIIFSSGSVSVSTRFFIYVLTKRSICLAIFLTLHSRSANPEFHLANFSILYHTCRFSWH